MSKLLFGFDLDGGMPPEGCHGLDRGVVGQEGLLVALESALGLPTPTVGASERSHRFRECLASTPSKDTAPFLGSFEKDPIATSQLLLGLRDDLAIAGWTAEIDHSDAPPRLRALCALETPFWATPAAASCHAGRIRAIRAELENGIPRPDIALQTSAPLEHLPPLWIHLLEQLGATTAPLTPEAALADGQLRAFQASLLGLEPPSAGSHPDRSIQVVTASTPEAAAEALATQHSNAAADRSLLIAATRDRTRLNPRFHAKGLPLVPSRAESGHAIHQLASLWINAQIAPFDPQAWLAFLLHPLCPIPQPLRRALASELNRTPGRSESWSKVLETCLEELVEDADHRKRLTAAFETWLGIAPLELDSAAPNDIAALLAPLQTWLGKRAK